MDIFLGIFSKFVSGTIATMHEDITKKEKIIAFTQGMFVGLVILAIALFQLPAVRDRLLWRVDFAMAYVRGLIDPVQPMPTPLVLSEEVDSDLGLSVLPSPTAEPTQAETQAPTATDEAEIIATQAPSATAAPTLTPTAIPASVSLPVPAYEKQEINNCGPATLAMHLRFYGWEGDQKTIGSVVKPIPQDRNVNVEELAAYVHTQVEGLEILYRVGGDIDTLRRLIAAGFPVTIEEAFIMDESYWVNDDRWAGHYLLLTGYDDATQRFTGQDSFIGPNISIPYSVLDANWKAFNRVYILVYPYDQRETVHGLLGEHWDVDYNRQHALEVAQKETEEDPTDSFAWFNLGTNLVYFERYGQAAKAYDEARLAGLPQRMLRYQFGPFFAYFHSGRIDELLALTEYALKRTPNSEEALLWRGWAMYRQNDRNEALKAFQEALAARPDYPDAIYALKFLQEN